MNEATRIRPPAAELGASGEEFQNLHEFVRKARARLNQNSWDYIVGAAETETTMRRNRHALDCLALRPRILRDVSKIDATGSILGHRLRIPVVLAPIGSLQTITPEGGIAVARAAAEFGVIPLVSTVSTAAFCAARTC